MARTTWILTLVGKRRSGKTTFLIKNIARKYKAAYPKRKIVWVYPYTDHLEVQQLKPYDFRFTGMEKDLWKRLANIKNCLIIFDDIKRYTIDNDKRLNDFIIECGHHSQDVVVTYHSFKRVHPFIFEQTDKIVSFKTLDVWADVKSRMPPQVRESHVKLANLIEPYKYFEIKM